MERGKRVRHERTVGDHFCVEPLVERVSGARRAEQSRVWATNFGAFSATDTFDVTVVGGSGTLVLSGIVPGDFFGFLDPAGLTSVSFANTAASPSNYALDDVTTAGPEPSTALLLVAGLAVLAGRPGVRQRSIG